MVLDLQMYQENSLEISMVVKKEVEFQGVTKNKSCGISTHDAS